MSEDRRQNDRRVGEKDRRKGDRRNKEDKKTLTLTLTTFITIVIVIIVLFVTTLAFMAVYFERKLNAAINESKDPILDSQGDEYIDISNILNELDINIENNSEENGFSE